MSGKNTVNRKLTDEEFETIKEMYPHFSNQEIAEKIGISKQYVLYISARNDWNKTPEYISRMRSEYAKTHHRESVLNTPEAIAKRIDTRRKLDKNDQIRIQFGLVPKQKRHFRLEPRAKLLQRNYLIRRGYIIDELKLTAYFTQSTLRCTSLEKIERGKTKGKMKAYYSFEPYKKDTE